MGLVVAARVLPQGAGHVTRARHSVQFSFALCCYSTSNCSQATWNFIKVDTEGAEWTVFRAL